MEKLNPPKYLSLKDYENYLLVVSSANDELKIKTSYIFKGKPTSFELTLFTNKRGEKNASPWSADRSVKEDSKTQIKKNKIVREYAFKVETDGIKGSYRGNEKYYLSKDGSKLIFEKVQTFPSATALLGPGYENKFIFRKEIK